MRQLWLHRYIFSLKTLRVLALALIFLSSAALLDVSLSAGTRMLVSVPVIFLITFLYVQLCRQRSAYIFFASALFFFSLYCLYQLLTWHHSVKSDHWMLFHGFFSSKLFVTCLVVQLMGLFTVFVKKNDFMKTSNQLMIIFSVLLLSVVFFFISYGPQAQALSLLIYWFLTLLYLCLFLVCLFCVNDIVFCASISAMLMIVYALCYQFTDPYILPYPGAAVILSFCVFFATLALHLLRKVVVTFPVKWAATSIHAYICLVLIFISVMFFSIIHYINLFPVEQVNWHQWICFAVLLFTFSAVLSRMLSFFISQSIRCASSGYQDGQQGLVGQFVCRRFHFYELDELNKIYANTLSDLHDVNREKSDFLVNMSHDFRTPASGIFSMSQLIYSKLVDEKLIHLQGLVVDASKQLMRILDEVMIYSKMDLSPNSGDFSLINLISVIDDVSQLMTPKASEKQLSLNVVHETGYLTIITDKMMVHRILINVVSNAVKFTDHGFIKITSGYKEHNNDHMVYIKVEDSGIGIDPKCHRRVFEPFFKVRQDNRQHDGVGLGLSISRLMIKKLGGVIELNSALSLGACFTILLPAKLRRNGENIF